MTARATGSFTVSGWDESTYEDLGDGGKLTKAHVTFGFDGDLDGEGGWEAVMCYRADGTFENGEARTNWEVVDGSATDDLRGLRGTGTAVTTSTSGGDFALDYELG